MEGGPNGATNTVAMQSGVAVILGQRIYLLVFVTNTVLFVTFLRGRRRNYQNTGATATGPAHPQAWRAILCLRAFDSLSKPTAYSKCV